MRTLTLFVGLWFTVIGCGASQPPTETEGERYVPTPAGILTPSAVESRLGTLRFFDGMPDEGTIDRVYDHLDLMRGVRAYLQGIPGASMVGMREGLFAAGLLPNYTIFVSDRLIDSRSQFLTFNTETIYATAWISLKGGPIVVETPPRTLGVFVDSWQRHLTDTGYPGPDRGKGGRYVIVPPGYAGYVPDSEFAVRSRTLGVWMLLQGLMVEGKTRPAAEAFRTRLKVYPLKESAHPPPNQFVDMSSKEIDTIPPTGLRYFEALDALVQEEPRESQDPELLGTLASIGIEKDEKFAPDARMQAILSAAAAVGDATVRALLFGERNPAPRLTPNSHWRAGEMAESHEFIEDHARTLDRRASSRYYATGHTPRLVDDLLGRRFESAVVFRDNGGQLLDGGRTYTMTLPAGVPAKNFWSVVVYDNQTRSMLRTGQRFPSINTAQAAVHDRPPPRPNDDGSITLYFAPRPPKAVKRSSHGGRRGRAPESNWIQTVPGRGWNAILRLYGALDAWRGGAWRPGEIELLSDVPPVTPRKGNPPGKSSEGLAAAGSVGPLEFTLGVPNEITSERLYENLAFLRAVDTFLRTIPGASIAATRRGLRSVGIEDASTVGIFERSIDSHSLFLTPSAESVNAITWLNLRGGAMVVESSPSTTGLVDDAFFRYVADLGDVGPDHGEGGLFLFTPPKYQGQVSERYFAFASSTFGNLLRWRALATDGDPLPTATRLENTIRTYPFDFDFDEDFDFDAVPAEAEGAEESDANQNAEVPRFVRLSGRPMNTVHANDATFYDEVSSLIQDEPPQAFDAEILGLLASIGIRHGQQFDPDPSSRATLADAAAVANATARALAFRPRDRDAYLYEDAGWYTRFFGNSSRFLRNGARMVDARTRFFFLTTMISPTITRDDIGKGSRSAINATDSKGRYLDGASSYAMTLPPQIPARHLWSVVVYDPQTRSMLQTPNSPTPRLSSQTGSVVPNADGSVTIHFGPRAPLGRESNWIQTVPGKGWFTVLRLYGPLEHWYDKTWRPGDIVRTP
ncbi:MAG: DUF1214 domain-containing protein [Polyangiales bacterium]